MANKEPTYNVPCEGQKLSSSETCSVSTSPAPKPKPRTKNYQYVEPKQLSSDPSSNKSPPLVPKKPSNYTPVSLHKAPPLLPVAEGGKVDVKALAEKLSSETIIKKVSDEATPPTSQGGRNIEDPLVPRRIRSCYEKQPSADSVVVTVPPKLGPRVQSESSMPAPTPVDLNWLPTGESLTLTELARAHSSRFPLRIYLLDGYYGQTSRFTLSSSDIFDIHFAKRTQVLSVRDSVGTDYSIPLNSAIQFGIIYGYMLPKSAKKPVMHYDTVQELLALDPLPSIVCATASWAKPSDKENKVGVERNELLLVKGIFKSRLRGKKALKCYSLKTQTKKLLPEECEGKFTINPEAVKLHVYEFAAKFKTLFPCKAMMFLCSDKKDDAVFRSIPKSLLLKPISVLKMMSEVSLAATSVSNQRSPPLDPKIPRVDFKNKPIKSALTMEIPLDSHLGDIEAEILQAPSKAETEVLYMNTKELLQKANKEPYMILLDKGSDRINDTQSVLYMQVRSENCDLGVTYETSEAVYERLDLSKRSQDSAAAYAVPENRGTKTGKSSAKVAMEILEEDEGDSDSSAEHYYEDLDKALNSLSLSPAAQQLAPAAPSHFSPSPISLFPSQHLPPPEMQHKKLYLPENAGSQSSYYSSSVPTSATQLQLPHQIQSTSYVHMVPPSSVPGKSSTHVPRETKMANRDFLQNMSTEQVRQLLEAMNLTQYQNKFASEGIGGDILMELEDQDLQNDLGMKSKVHRVRLMKIIKGQHSAKNILEGENPYEL
jgi:hypothetical protein